MNCETIIGITDFGLPITKNKIQYKSLDIAISVAQKLNLKPNRVYKLVAYKCPDCHQYHVGRNKKILTTKEKEKIKNKMLIKKANIKFKIVGKIDL